MNAVDSGLIAPHGGELVSRAVDGRRQAELEERLGQMARIRLPEQQQCDLEMIAIGAFSPLEGFMGQADFRSVCDRMQLADGLPWGIPITCCVDQAAADGLEIGQELCLTDQEDRPLAVMQLQEKYSHDKPLEAEKVYLTTDKRHPGVKVLFDRAEVCIAGPVEALAGWAEPDFAEWRLPPSQTRRIFAERGWRSVVAFQTRNPIHRAHEYLTKCALEVCDGLLIHPLVGQTQPGDIPADVRMRCYEVLIERYYNAERVVLSCMPSAMRYAGPREAVLHAIIRKNYGCTHFIVGRDHAGVGDYYGTYDAQHIFERIDPAMLGIVPLKFEHASWCKICQAMVSDKTCPHDSEQKVFLSGTKVREMLGRGQRPPEQFTRPEVAEVLIKAMKP